MCEAFSVRLSPPSDASINVQVITPSAGGPAEKAGVEPRDVLLAIGERPIDNISLYEAGDLLQGTEGTEASTNPVSACLCSRSRILFEVFAGVKHCLLKERQGSL